MLEVIMSEWNYFYANRDDRDVVVCDKYGPICDMNGEKAKQIERAKLICSAPDLYEACRDAGIIFAELNALKPNVMDRGYIGAQEAYRRIQLAIAKAEGK
jgi:hypothetical protein